MSQTDIPRAAPPSRTRSRSFPSLRTISALVLREMSTTNGRSPGGYLWAILEPTAGIALLSIVFSLAFREPALGTSFPLFYATGLIPFILFLDLSNKIAASLLFSKPLMSYPTVTFVDALLARFLLNAGTQLMVGYVVFTGLLVLQRTRVVTDLITIAEAYVMVSVLAFGVGTMNCFFITRFPVYQRLWSIAMRPMFIISCIFFLFDSIPLPYRDYLWFNPLVHVVGLMRRGFYPGYDATYVSHVYVYGLSLGMLLVGVFLLWRYGRELLDR
ncbi:capsular polysaccharide transport system permease protein [Rhodovulum imhoffii]|uniref:Capsular polysaccharide transport system permease protein n=1 Tax=Rhodovulum imhoffii TaxID=365340 RepID=A0A2T5BPB3_9RHOB|nr:ABC transporter permease [Rhodovulum imhoffii]MBK5932937.1 sugar ABC transporter permease [Rhodovulum imhoffii]PTN00873.1 capsular polysaccharide transport system permease protein [Rhodovulum imhoffii]